MMLMTIVIINLNESILKVVFLVFVLAVATNEFAKNTIYITCLNDRNLPKANKEKVTIIN